MKPFHIAGIAERPSGGEKDGKARAIHAEEVRGGRQGVADVTPRKFQVIQFAAEIFKSGPKHGNEPGRFAGAPAIGATVGEQGKERNPEGEDDPQDNGGELEDVPEKEKLRSIAEKAGGEAEVKGAARGWLIRQPDQGESVAENEQAGGGKAQAGIGGLKARDGQQQPEQGLFPSQSAGGGRLKVHLAE